METSHHHTLSVAVTGFESDFPVLARAAHRTFEADHPVELEWTINGRAGRNHFQINRTAWSQSHGDTSDRRDEKLHQHLSDIERVLVYGAPRNDTSRGWPCGFCGGALHFLGRMPTVDDHLRLAVLLRRELVFYEYDQGLSIEREWLTEFSLEIDGEPEPEPDTRQVKAWAEENARLDGLTMINAWAR